MTRFPRFALLRAFQFLSLITMTSALAACGLAEPVAPTQPSPATITDTYNGTFTQLGQMSHPFEVTAEGRVAIQLTSLSPLSTMGLGMAVGTWDGTSCAGSIVFNNDARLSSVALAGTALPGNYCVRVFDSGNLTASMTVTYTVQVTHP